MTSEHDRYFRETISPFTFREQGQERTTGAVEVGAVATPSALGCALLPECDVHQATMNLVIPLSQKESYSLISLN